MDANGDPLTSDQRGAGFRAFRIGLCRYRAFEANLQTPSLIVTTTSDSPNIGQNSLREAIAYADTLSSDPTDYLRTWIERRHQPHPGRVADYHFDDDYRPGAPAS